MNHMAAFGISPNAGAFVLTIPALCCKNIFLSYNKYYINIIDILNVNVVPRL